MRRQTISDIALVIRYPYSGFSLPVSWFVWCPVSVFPGRYQITGIVVHLSADGVQRVQPRYLMPDVSSPVTRACRGEDERGTTIPDTGRTTIPAMGYRTSDMRRQTISDIAILIRYPYSGFSLPVSLFVWCLVSLYYRSTFFLNRA